MRRHTYKGIPSFQTTLKLGTDISLNIIYFIKYGYKNTFLIVNTFLSIISSHNTLNANTNL